MLFRKKIDRYCTYCQFAGKIDGESMVCQFCGVVPSDHHCRRFRYDPLYTDHRYYRNQCGL